MCALWRSKALTGRKINRCTNVNHADIAPHQFIFKIDIKEILCQDWFIEGEFVKCTNNDNSFLTGLALYW